MVENILKSASPGFSEAPNVEPMVYPTIFQDRFVVEPNGNPIKDLALVNQSGHMFWLHTWTGDAYPPLGVTLPYLPSGKYFLRISLKNGRVVTKRMIKR